MKIFLNPDSGPGSSSDLKKPEILLMLIKYVSIFLTSARFLSQEKSKHLPAIFIGNVDGILCIFSNSLIFSFTTFNHKNIKEMTSAVYRKKSFV